MFHSQSTTMVLLVSFIALLVFLLAQLVLRNTHHDARMDQFMERMDAQQQLLMDLLMEVRELGDMSRKWPHHVAEMNAVDETWKEFAARLTHRELSPSQLDELVDRMANARAEEEDEDNEEREVVTEEQEVEKKLGSDDLSEFLPTSFYLGDRQQAFYETLEDALEENKMKSRQLDKEIHKERSKFLEEISKRNETENNGEPEKIYLPANIAKMKLHRMMLRTGSRIAPVFEGTSFDELAYSEYESMDPREKKRIKRDLSIEREKSSVDQLFPLHIFDGHDRSLVHWLNHIEKGTISCKNLTLLHFDSRTCLV